MGTQESVLAYLPFSDSITGRPLAVAGLRSYRYRGPYGWVMIGATDDADALKQAQRSVTEVVIIENLQTWNGVCYSAMEAAP